MADLFDRLSKKKHTKVFKECKLITHNSRTSKLPLHLESPNPKLKKTLKETDL